MGELRDAEPIHFDFEAARQLALEFGNTAGLLRAQIGHRNGLAAGAREEWRGAYEVQFGVRMGVCATDASRLADAMELAAREVQELARLAQEEQQRRAVAREWKERHDAWEREQSNDNIFEDIGDSVFGTGEPIPPELTPTAPPTIPLEAPAPGHR